MGTLMTQKEKSTQGIMELMRKNQQLRRQNQQVLERMQQMVGILSHTQQRSHVHACTTEQYNTHMYCQFGCPTIPHFLDEPKEKHGSRMRSSCRGGQLEGEIGGVSAGGD